MTKSLTAFAMMLAMATYAIGQPVTLDKPGDPMPPTKIELDRPGGPAKIVLDKPNDATPTPVKIQLDAPGAPATVTPPPANVLAGKEKWLDHIEPLMPRDYKLRGDTPDQMQLGTKMKMLKEKFDQRGGSPMWYFHDGYSFAAFIPATHLSAEWAEKANEATAKALLKGSGEKVLKEPDGFKGVTLTFVNTSPTGTAFVADKFSFVFFHVQDKEGKDRPVGVKIDDAALKVDESLEYFAELCTLENVLKSVDASPTVRLLPLSEIPVPKPPVK